MGDRLICPRTGEDCSESIRCRTVNAPLSRAIYQIQEGVLTSDLDTDTAQKLLGHQFSAMSRILGVELSSQFGEDGSATICPEEAMSGNYGRGIKPELAAKNLGRMAGVCVDNVITDWNIRSGPLTSGAA